MGSLAKCCVHTSVFIPAPPSLGSPNRYAKYAANHRIFLCSLLFLEKMLELVCFNNGAKRVNVDADDVDANVGDDDCKCKKNALDFHQHRYIYIYTYTPPPHHLLPRPSFKRCTVIDAHGHF